MEKIIEDKYFDELGVTLTDFICYQNAKASLNEIKAWLGDAKFLEMLNLFAGSYLLIPPAKDLISDMYDYMAALCIARIKNARKTKDLRLWSEQEEVLHKIARRTKRTYRYVRTRGMRCLQKMDKIKLWSRKMKIFESKYFLGEER